MIAAPITPPVHARHLTINQPAPGENPNKKIKFVNPNVDNYDRNIKHAGELHKAGMPCYKQDELKKDGVGPVVVVAGSGPTLNDPEVIASIRKAVDEEDAIIFGCKAAIKILHDAGFKVDYGVSMDPGAHIAKPNKIFKAPGTKHIIASSSDPALFDYLKDEDVIIFHSATGYENEVKLYNELFATSTCMGGGYNVVNRAVSAAFFMGARKVILAGTDCGWRKDETMYADGPAHREGVDMCDNGVVDGKPWMTRPDMLASGVALAKLAKKRPNDIVFLGDTLPSKLVHKDDDFLNSCASFGK